MELPDRYAGWLEKKNKINNASWRQRYFALRGQHLVCLSDPEKEKIIASIDVVKVEVAGPDADEDDSIFNLKVLEGSIKLRAPSADERRRWMNELLQAQDESLETSRRVRSQERRNQVIEAHNNTLRLRQSYISSSSRKEEVSPSIAEKNFEQRPVPAAAIEISSPPPAIARRPSPLVRANTDIVGGPNKKILPKRPSYQKSNSLRGVHQQEPIVSAHDWGEIEAEQWISNVLKEYRPKSQVFWDWLKDGTILCRLAHALLKASVGGIAADACINISKLHRSERRAYHLENISLFLQACRHDFELPESRLFDALDLYDGTGTRQVLYSLHALRTAASPRSPSNGYVVNGASSEKNTASPGKRQQMFNNSFMHETVSIQQEKEQSSSFLTCSHEKKIIPSSPPISPSSQRKTGKLPSYLSSRKNGNNLKADPSYKPTHAQIDEEHATSNYLEDDSLATVIEDHFATRDDELTVYADQVVTVKLSKGGWCFEEGIGEGWSLVQKGSEQGLVPRHKLKAGVLDQAYLKSGAGRGDSQIDRILAAKNAAKYDSNAEALAQHWIEQVTGYVFRLPFAEELKSGVILCKLINGIVPDTVTRVYEGNTAFGQMDNITTFLKYAKKWGVRSSDAFNTVDLYEGRDLNLVVQCLFALSNAVKDNIPSFHGPYLTGHDAGFTDAIMSNLKVIVAVNDYRDRNRRAIMQQQQQQQEQQAAKNLQESDSELIDEAVEYRLAMLGLRDCQVSGANVHGVDRNSMQPSFLVVWSSSTKSNLAMEKNERRLIALLAAKKKKYEMVYLDVSPERRIELRTICQDNEVPLPALTFGPDYHGDYEKLQELEDDGLLDELLNPADDGEGFWALPEAWNTRTSMLESGGMTIISEVPDM